MSPSLVSGEEDGLKGAQVLHGSDLAQHVLCPTSTSDLDGGPTDIQRFYSGARVLVTGATGFMGKVLVEKLLRSCPDIDSVYMMVREKRGRSVDKRIEDIVGSPCFDVIKKIHPDFRSKLHAFAGDMEAVGLGISDEDRQMLEQQINIVFHLAATVRFDEQLKLAVLQNVRGTREVLNLCRTFTNIKSIVHVSTAYSNCPNSQIDERFYEPPLPSDYAIHMAETLDASTIDHLSHKLMRKWPNTYAFTKALSENVVSNHGQGLPIGVFRPSIVLSTYKEPTPGWIDNVYGPMGLIVAGFAGLLRTMKADNEAAMNVVPCDMAISALIATASDIAETRAATEIPVYNYVLPNSNSVTLNRIQSHYNGIMKDCPPSRALWYPMLVSTNNSAVYFLLQLLLHYLPALLMDICFVAINRSPQMIRVYHKIHKLTNVLTYFSTKEWVFENKNTEEMWNGLKEKDKKLFYFDMDSLDWHRFVKDTSIGLRVNLLRDPVETLPAAKIQFTRLTILHRSLQGVLGVFAIWISLQILPLIGAAIQTALEYSILSWIGSMKNTSLNEVN